MIRDKVAHYLKALPKAWRNRLIPLPETVTEFLERPRRPGQSLIDAMRDYLHDRLGDAPPAAVFHAVDLPAHLRINVRVIDAAGEELAMNRDLAAVQESLREAAQLSFAAEGPAFERKGLRQWDFGELPETLTMRRDGQRLTGYPALCDEQDGVALTLLDTRDAADAATRQGVHTAHRIRAR